MSVRSGKADLLDIREGKWWPLQITACSKKQKEALSAFQNVEVDYRVESCHWHLKMQQKEATKKWKFGKNDIQGRRNNVVKERED